MTTFGQNGKTVAQRLRVRGSGLDPTSTRQRVENLLQAVDMQPTGLAPSAILCVRTLRDPLPGKLQLREREYAMRPPPEWERAAVSSLNQLARDAARPAREAVPANAEAVLFADHAEALACLASDWCEGVAGTRWWWLSLFKEVDIARTVVPAWLDAPTYIPAALQHLAARRKAIPFARALSSGEARSLLQSIIRSHTLYALQAALDAVLDGDDATIEQAVARSSPQISDEEPLVERGDLATNIYERQSPVARRQAAQTTSASAPWQRWVPECGDGELGHEQLCLLGIGLMVQRAPMLVSTQAFVSTLLHWARAEKSAGVKAAVNAVAESGCGIEPGRLSAKASEAIVTERFVSTSTFAGAGEEEHFMSVETRDVARSPSMVKSTLQNNQQEQPLPETTLSSPGNPLSQEQQDREQELEAVQPLPKIAASTPGEVEAKDTTCLLEAHIETALGGLFYLINLGLFLGLYGDFTTPAEPGIALSIWDFIALLGWKLLRNKEDLPSDPVWSLLARMAGRSGQEAPGNDFAPPGSWRLPGEWLRSFPEEGTWLWAAENGRLRVLHPAQFLVLDLPLESTDPLQQLLRETQAYTACANFALQQGSSPGEGPVGGDAPLERWLGWLMPYVRIRLCRALDLADTDEPGHMLCVHRAQIFVTATHIDIVLALDELPIEIRMAGLDRNPGWVLAAGRLIAFHFEQKSSEYFV